MQIFNATQHPATPDQIQAGVIPTCDPQVKVLLTFDSIPTKSDMIRRANEIAHIVGVQHQLNACMIAGAPYFMPILEETLVTHGLNVYYAFSKRESIEVIVGNAVEKKNVFKHKGFYIVEGKTREDCYE